MQGHRPECPTCKAHVKKSDNPAYPFCSPRCKLADLERWLNGSYRVSGEPVEPPEEGV